MESLRHELGWIRTFLKDAESKQSSDARVRKWVDDVREVAFTVILVTLNPSISSVLMKPTKLKFAHKIGDEINMIETRICEINEYQEKYNIKDLGESNAVPMRRPVREFVLADMDDPDVVGLQTDKENIVKLLLDLETRRRYVVSIVGQGSLGKMTLAREAHNRLIYVYSNLITPSELGSVFLIFIFCWL
jgi:Rx N-terminal domain